MMIDYDDDDLLWKVTRVLTLKCFFLKQTCNVSKTELDQTFKPHAIQAIYTVLV